MRLRCTETSSSTCSLLKTYLMIRHRGQMSANEDPSVPQDGHSRKAMPSQKSHALQQWCWRSWRLATSGDDKGIRLCCAPSFPTQTGLPCTPRLFQGLQKQSSKPAHASHQGWMAENCWGTVTNGQCEVCEFLLTTLRAPLLSKARMVLK